MFQPRGVSILEAVRAAQRSDSGVEHCSGSLCTSVGKGTAKSESLARIAIADCCATGKTPCR